MSNFEEANKKVHKVEDQWHYETMIKFGYKPITKEVAGFVRAYSYKHPETGHIIECRTGTHADYFVDTVVRVNTKNFWNKLELHLKVVEAYYENKNK